MSVRVISGSAKGRKLKDPPGNTTRPVTDKVKQAVFNIIGQDVIDSTWWDVFGGTGAIGIEALSRGARFARFCELNRLPLEIIKSNLQICGFSDNAEVIRIDAFKMMSLAPDLKFDYIYIAPPQYHGLWIQSLSVMDGNAGWLEEDGWIIVQINPVEDMIIPLINFTRLDERKYGSTKLLFYQRKEEIQSETLITPG